MRVALKIDVDTDRGTREGVPALANLLRARRLPACFLFSLGPDNTGKAIRRVFRPGFFSKVRRTSVVRHYGVRTLLNGTLLPAPHIGRRNEDVLRRVRDAGFEVGIHCNDHFRWQDYLLVMKEGEVRHEFSQAQEEFARIFGQKARSAGAPGWQTNAFSRHAYDEADLLYASDTRGTSPFFPRIGSGVFRTLEIPTTLPTFDELLGRSELPDARIVDHYASLLRGDRLNVLTVHAEIEGMSHRELFCGLLTSFTDRGVEFVRLEDVARDLLVSRATVLVCDITMEVIDGRSGLVATQRVGPI